MAAHDPHDGFSEPIEDALVVLQLDVDQHTPAECLEHFIEARDPFAREPGVELRAGIQSLEVGEPAFRHASAAVGRAIEGEVVVHDDGAVGRQLGVQLDGVGPHLGRQTEGGQRVLGGVSAARRDGQSPAGRGATTPTRWG